MADLLRIRARNGAGITWEFVDKHMQTHLVKLDQPPTCLIKDGDIWRVEEVEVLPPPIDKPRGKKTAIVRLVAKLQSVKPWENLTSLPDFWVDPVDLKNILCWLHEGTDIVLVGPKGVGKTTLPYMIASALQWQEPYKVDVYTIKRTTDLFGTDAASEGSTVFRRSGLLDYIERAHIALREGLDAQFLVILDEINRVHAKSNESMHGLFDDTRQVSIITTEGSRTIKLPPNIHFVGTMNRGSQYLGTHEMDEALKDRFEPVNLRPMPLDYEVKKLVGETNILESQALVIVEIARVLRGASEAGQISFSPSYRGCRNVARLVVHGVDLKTACIKGLLGWYEGDLDLDEKGRPKNPNSEIAKAFSALRMKGATAKDLQGKVADVFKGGAAS